MDQNQKKLCLAADLPPAARAALQEQLQRLTDIKIVDQGADLTLTLKSPPDPTPEILTLPRSKNKARLGEWLGALSQALHPRAIDLKFGALSLLPAQKILKTPDLSLPLTDREAEVLRYFFTHPSQVISREDLLQNVFRYHADADTRTVETHIYRLRQKLESANCQGLLITEDGGYRLSTPEKTAAEQGNVILYMLAALALLGLVVASLSSGSDRSQSAAEIDRLENKLWSEIATVESAITECVLTYPRLPDESGPASSNPNKPYPLSADLNHPETGSPLATIKCPGAPLSRQTIFDQPQHRLDFFINTPAISAKYYNTESEGVMIKIIWDRLVAGISNSAFYEAATRLDKRFSQCKAEVRSTSWPGDDDDCDSSASTKICFLYWIKVNPGHSNQDPGC